MIDNGLYLSLSFLFFFQLCHSSIINALIFASRDMRFTNIQC